MSYAALRARFLDDTALGGMGATPALTRALERIGWRAVRDPSPEELAGDVYFLLEACVREHHDVDALAWATATLLRDSGPLLDGGLPPIDAYVPAAEELLQQYVRGADSSPPSFAPPSF
ncbi:MAG: hypothetical protein ACXW65_15215 [Gemmatirosa sp.]